MSYKHLAWAMEQDLPSTNCFAVLCALAGYADDKGICWPSQTTISQKTKMARETVSRTIKILRDLGYIKTSGNRYRLQMGSVTHDHKIVTEDHISHETDCDPRSQDCDLQSQGCDPRSQPSEPVKESVKESVVAEMRAGAIRAVDVGNAIAEITGWANDPNWMGNYSRIEVWLSAGWHVELDILPTIRRLMAARDGPPRSLNYFEQAIADAHKTRMKPVPEGKYEPSSNNRKSGGIADELRHRQDLRDAALRIADCNWG